MVYQTLMVEATGDKRQKPCQIPFKNRAGDIFLYKYKNTVYNFYCQQIPVEDQNQ